MGKLMSAKGGSPAKGGHGASGGRKIISIFSALAMSLMSFGSLVAMPATALAATQNAVYDSLTGTVYPVGGTTVDAVAVPDDGKFIQMDVGSAIILKFPSPYVAMPDGTHALDLEINTYDALYPASAEISVSLDGSTWTSLGVHSDTANIDLNLEATGPVKYVKVDQGNNYIDPAYPTLGFDLDAVVALNSVDENQIPTTGTLTIVKNTVGGDGTFNFIVAGPTPSTPSILTASNTGTTGPLTVNAGTYSVTEGALPANWTPTSGSCINSSEVLVTDLTNIFIAGGNSVTCSFTNTKTTPQTGSISGMKFNDKNGNGQKDSGEPGLPNWTISLFNGSATTTTTTDINGNYAFSNLPAGNYTVSEVQQNGWMQTFPAPPGTYSVNLSAGQNVIGENFGNHKINQCRKDDNDNDHHDGNEDDHNGLGPSGFTLNNGINGGQNQNPCNDDHHDNGHHYGNDKGDNHQDNGNGPQGNNNNNNDNKGKKHGNH